MKSSLKFNPREPFKLNPKRTLMLPAYLTEELADKLIVSLAKLSRKQKEIYLQINSRGGSWPGGIKLYDAIKADPREVIGIVTGDAFSMAALILQACSLKLASSNSRLGIHLISYTISFTLKPSDKNEDIYRFVDKELTELRRKNQVSLEILKKGLTISEKKIDALLNRGEIMSAQKAKEIGLIDEVINPV